MLSLIYQEMNNVTQQHLGQSYSENYIFILVNKPQDSSVIRILEIIPLFDGRLEPETSSDHPMSLSWWQGGHAKNAGKWREFPESHRWNRLPGCSFVKLCPRNFTLTCHKSSNSESTYSTMRPCRRRTHRSGHIAGEELFPVQLGK